MPSIGVGVRFETGQVVATKGVHHLMREDEAFRTFVDLSLVRHQKGDWGDVGPADREMNERALVEGTRIFSAYVAKGQPKVWIITEEDRSATTVLFPSEY